MCKYLLAQMQTLALCPAYCDCGSKVAQCEVVECSFEDGLQLVKLRGESMQAAADSKPSAMVSVIGLSSEKVRTQELCCDLLLLSCPYTHTEHTCMT